MMQAIQIEHYEAFADVSAFVILRNGVAVATVAFKYPGASAGQIHAYVRWFGAPMTRGFAAMERVTAPTHHITSEAAADAARKLRIVSDNLGLIFIEALGKDDGDRWSDRLKKAGFQVIQAV